MLYTVALMFIKLKFVFVIEKNNPLSLDHSLGEIPVEETK
jgi:hypothetical protein